MLKLTDFDWEVNPNDVLSVRQKMPASGILMPPFTIFHTSPNCPGEERKANAKLAAASKRMLQLIREAHDSFSTGTAYGVEVHQKMGELLAELGVPTIEEDPDSVV